MRKQVRKIIQSKSEAHKDLSHPTIFHGILDSDLPPSEKGVERLMEEGHIVIAAGQETLSVVLTYITYHLLANPSVLRALKQELLTAIPDPDIAIPEAALAKLPYLTGVIKEGLRLGYGITGRLYRLPQAPLAFSTPNREWVIPAGTPVCMDAISMHTDESIFPDPTAFRPERWIDNPRLDRYLVSFSKGSRQCLGINLAYAEMYLWLAGVFRRYGSPECRFEGDEGVLELVGTEREDVEVCADRVIPVTRPGSQIVRFRVLE